MRRLQTHGHVHTQNGQHNSQPPEINIQDHDFFSPFVESARVCMQIADHLEEEEEGGEKRWIFKGRAD